MLLDRIELFVNVAKHRSLAKTARGMHVSSSSISQRLKSLENDFGVKLYRRHKDGIELTESGRILLTTASQVLHQIDSLRRTLNPDFQKASKRLIIGATYNPSAKHLPIAMAKFQKLQPNMEVTLLTSYRRTVEQWVRSGEVDIALIQSPSETCRAELFTEHFATDELVFFAHAGHPLSARRQKIQLGCLAHSPLILREGRGTTLKMLGLLRSRGVKLSVALRCGSPDAVKAAVRRKMGIGLLFRNLIEEDVKRKEFKILYIADLPQIVGDSYIVYNQNRPLSGSSTEFLALLRDMVSANKKLSLGANGPTAGLPS